ncbi:hypothetical protein PR202_ga29368 [Eleusine coracana subsp. coracana]|uniref:Uncharacterized protein n=1 Tax=Eleusine coracana subsp. coracana TaxID=191504 RepID=A0AAV5DL56_ELECO|nr:hypothetical protein PR202_ga29368 [Eleusine coracana subsp. coracana]
MLLPSTLGTYRISSLDILLHLIPIAPAPCGEEEREEEEGPTRASRSAGLVAFLRGCFSFGSAGRRRPKPSPLPSPPRLPSTSAAAAAADEASKMKGLFKSKPRTPADVVRQTRELLVYIDLNSGPRSGDAKREEKMAELSRNIRELKSILYGNGEQEPTRKDATQVVANLQRQQVSSRIVASEYLESNKSLGHFNLWPHPTKSERDPLTYVCGTSVTACGPCVAAGPLVSDGIKLVPVKFLHSKRGLTLPLNTINSIVGGIKVLTLFVLYENMDIALHYGAMLRECIRHQSIARYVLESEHMKKFFDYIQLPNFDIASDASATFKLLGDMLLDRSNSAVMMRYVSSKDNLMILMNLLRDSSKNIQIEAFHVFKLFAANKNKPPEVVNILVTNRSKLLRFFAGFKIDKEDEQFEADKEQVIKEISGL